MANSKYAFLCVTSGSDNVNWSEINFRGSKIVSTATKEFPNSCTLETAEGKTFFVAEVKNEGFVDSKMETIHASLKEGEDVVGYEFPVLWAEEVAAALADGVEIAPLQVKFSTYYPEYVAKSGNRTGIGYAVLCCKVSKPIAEAKEVSRVSTAVKETPAPAPEKKPSKKAKAFDPFAYPLSPCYKWADDAEKEKEKEKEETVIGPKPITVLASNKGFKKIYKELSKTSEKYLLEGDIEGEVKAKDEFFKSLSTELSVKLERDAVGKKRVSFYNDDGLVGNAKDTELSEAEMETIEAAGKENVSASFSGFDGVCPTVDIKVSSVENEAEIKELAMKSGCFASKADFDRHYELLSKTLMLPPYMVKAVFSAMHHFEDEESIKRIPRLEETTLYKDSIDAIPQAVCDYLSKRGIALVGAKSVGKNVLTKTLCLIFRIPLYEYSITEETTEDKLKGGKVFDTDENGNTIIVQERVQMIDWAEKGGMLVLDEMNMARPGVMALINPIADDRRCFEVPGKAYKLHPTCSIVLTYNDGDGSFSGTQDLNEATLSRFSVIRFDYPVTISDVLTHTAVSRGYYNEDTEKRIEMCDNIWSTIHVRAFGTSPDFTTTALNIRGFEAALSAGSIFGEGRGEREFVMALKRNLSNGISDKDERERLELIINTAIEGVYGYDADDLGDMGDDTRL